MPLVICRGLPGHDSRTSIFLWQRCHTADKRFQNHRWRGVNTLVTSRGGLERRSRSTRGRREAEGLRAPWSLSQERINDAG
eukprot:875761-Prymnesium_polylepis.1